MVKGAPETTHKYKGYLIRGEINGQGDPYYNPPNYWEVTVEEKEDGYYFYNDEGKLIFKAKTLSGEHREVEIDSFENRLFYGYYWDFLSEEEINYLWNEVLAKNEGFEDWLKEKYAGWGF